jgi:16S rRNA (guanine(1405)-N(7))-methyltransferase
MPRPTLSDLDTLVDEIRHSPKYQHVATDFIRSLGEKELQKRASYKEAVKATRNKLHQVGGAYFEHTPHYAEWLDDMRLATSQGDAVQLRSTCRRLMSQHASTHERLPILEHFYGETLAGIAPVHSILDIACGLNPLAIPWIPLAPNASYYAVDIYEDLMSFVGSYLNLSGLSGQAVAGNVLASIPFKVKVELALMLKAIPCLEQIDRLASMRLLDQIDAQHLLISFPVHSLGGRSKGMVATYESRFQELMLGRGWMVQKFMYASEMAFLVSK